MSEASPMQAARDRLQAHGWITRRSEAFQHLPPPALETWLGPTQPEAAHCGGPSAWQVRLADARWKDSVSVRRLSLFDAAERAEVLALLPADEAGEAAPFAWAHRALCTEALHLRISARADGSGICWLEVEHHALNTPHAPLLIIEVEAGARCGLLEQHKTLAQTGAQNLRLIARVGEHAELQHLRWAPQHGASPVAHVLDVDIASGGHYAQALIATSSAYHLQRTDFRMHGEGAVSRQGVLILASEGQLDHQAYAHLLGQKGQSHVESLSLAQGSSKIVSNSYTEIATGATDSGISQHIAGIPLAGQPRMVLRPHLEISHDQVQASHGGTWGALPQGALFYAAQRGLEPAAAKRLVMQGMARALFERSLSAEAVAQWLDHDELAPALAALIQSESEAAYVR